MDFEVLEREVEAAVAADEKYERENSAKFRAVEQRVATYDEFRDIVKASHLTPLGKKEKIADPNIKNKNVIWNTVVSQASTPNVFSRSQCHCGNVDIGWIYPFITSCLMNRVCKTLDLVIVEIQSDKERKLLQYLRILQDIHDQLHNIFFERPCLASITNFSSLVRSSISSSILTWKTHHSNRTIVIVPN